MSVKTRHTAKAQVSNCGNMLLLLLFLLLWLEDIKALIKKTSHPHFNEEVIRSDKLNVGIRCAHTGRLRNDFDYFTVYISLIKMLSL